MPTKNDTTVPDGYKRCSKGDKCVNPAGPVLPATVEHFYSQHGNLCSYCKECYKKRVKTRYLDKRDEVLAYQADYRAVHIEEQRVYQAWYRQEYHDEKIVRDRIYYHEHAESICLKNKKLRLEHPEHFREYELKRREQKKEYYLAHREEFLARGRAYRQRCADQRREYNRRYDQAHVAERKERARIYRIVNVDKIRMACLRRRAKKASLPADFTENDYRSSLIYFNGGCAYCGNPPSLFDVFTVLHVEHFIPLSDTDHCPGTVPQNMVPACQDCNLKKGAKNPVDWIMRRFGKRKGKKILNRIEAYFSTVRFA